MRRTNHITRAAAYASSHDFCRIFDVNMNSLYLLAFLLTADHAWAEQCFVSSLEDVVEGNPVFREWADSWARRAIIQNAVRLMKPRPGDAGGSFRSASEHSGYKTLPVERHVEISAVLGLEPFERIVYVITVLEHYSDHECSLLLGCARQDVLPMRIRALEKIGHQVEMQDRRLTIAAPQNPGPDSAWSDCGDHPLLALADGAKRTALGPYHLDLGGSSWPLPRARLSEAHSTRSIAPTESRKPLIEDETDV